MKKLLKVTASTEPTIFDIPVTWQMRDVMSIPANSLKEAVRIVNEQEYDLPVGRYVEDSYEIDYERLENS